MYQQVPAVSLRKWHAVLQKLESADVTHMFMLQAGYRYFTVKQLVRSAAVVDDSISKNHSYAY